MSGCQKTLLGCAIGCGGLLVLAVIGGAVASWWLVRPGAQHPTAAVVSPAASGSFNVGDLGADRGVTALLDRFVRESQRQQQADMPPWIRQLQQLGAAQSSPSVGFRMLLPRQATVSLEPSTEGSNDPAVVAAINPRGLTRLLPTVLAVSHQVDGAYRGKEILRLGDHAWGALIDGTLVVASEEEALHGGIDRMLDGGAAPPPQPADLGLPSQPWDVTGTVDETDRELARALWGDAEEAPAGVRRAMLGVDVATSDTTNGRVVVDCDSPAAASAAALALDRRAAERAERLARHGLALRATSHVDGKRAVLDWNITGVDAALALWVADSQRNRYKVRR